MLRKMLITSSVTDSMAMLAVAGLCLGSGLIPPYGYRTVFVAFMAAVNFCNGWRLRRRAAAVADLSLVR
jgi:hypothetical protein